MHHEYASAADRERLRDVRAAVLLRLAGLRDAADDLDRAIEYGQRAFQADLCREDVCRRLMELYRRDGRPADSLRVYNACNAALRSELGVGPSAPTRRLLRLIQAELQGGTLAVASS